MPNVAVIYYSATGNVHALAEAVAEGPTLIGGLANRRDHLVPDRPMRQLISRHLQTSPVMPRRPS